MLLLLFVNVKAREKMMKKISFYFFIILLLSCFFYINFKTIKISEHSSDNLKNFISKKINSDVEIIQTLIENNDILYALYKDNKISTGVFVFKKYPLFKERYTFLGSSQTNMNYSMYRIENKEKNFVIVYGKNPEMKICQLTVDFNIEEKYVENTKSKKFFLYSYETKANNFPEVKIFDYYNNELSQY